MRSSPTESELNELFKRDQNEIKALFEQWDDNKPNLRFFMNMFEYVKFSERIKETLESINETSNARIVILETWLIVDYSIRRFLIVGLELYKFSDENFDILPHSFMQCLDLLRRFKISQAKKIENPHKFIVDLPPEFKNIIINDPDFFKKFVKYENVYYNEIGKINTHNLLDKENPKFRNVSEGWFYYATKLDDKWFKSVIKINEIRNHAAHEFEVNKIFKSMGISGDKKLLQLKQKCVSILKDTMGLK